MEFAQIDVLRRKLRTMKQSDKQPLQDFLNKWDSVRKELAQYGSHPLEYELGGELIRSLNRSFEKSIEYLFGALQVAVDKATAEVERINNQATAQIVPAAASAVEQTAAGQTTAIPTVENAGAAAAALALTANQEREAAISLAKSRIIEEVITAIYRSEANRKNTYEGTESSSSESKALVTGNGSKKGKKDFKKPTQAPSECKRCRKGLKHWHKDCQDPIFDLKTGKRLDDKDSNSYSKPNKQSSSSKSSEDSHAVLTITTSGVSTAVIASTSSLPWHCDSGAADHMSCVPGDFEDMIHHSQTVLVGGLHKLKSTGIGSIRLTVKVGEKLQELILRNALYVH